MDDVRNPTIPMLCFNPAECQQRQMYKLMTGMIVPRPVALVSTTDKQGVANLAPFSFFCGVGSNAAHRAVLPVAAPRRYGWDRRTKGHAAQR